MTSHSFDQSGHIITASDADLLSGGLTGWNQQYDQLTPGAFRGALQDIHLNGIRIFREFTSTGLRQSGLIAGEVIAFGVPVRATGRADFCGEPSHCDALHIFSGHDGFEFHTAPHLDIVGTALPIDVLSRFLAAHEIAPLIRMTGQSRIISLSPDAAQALRQHICGGLGAFAGAPDDAATMLRLQLWVQSLSAHLADLVPTQGHAARTRPRRREIFHQAIEHALATGRDEKTTIREICQAQGISRRSLQYAFADYAMMSPEKYLRCLRLNQARRMIRRNSPVTQAAVEWGFWHLGRFSAAYAGLFGERPSETAMARDGLRPRPQAVTQGRHG